MIYFASEYLFDGLARFNVVENKSLRLSFPEWVVGHQFVNHFMRGYFDGDGSVSTRRRDGLVPQLQMSLIGTSEFLTTYSDIISAQCDTGKCRISRCNKKTSICNIQYEGNRKCIKIRDFLYNHSASVVCLDRKRDILYSNFISNLPLSFRHKVVLGTNIESNCEMRFLSLKDAEQRGFDSASISACCHGRRKTHLGHSWKFEVDNEKGSET